MTVDPDQRKALKAFLHGEDVFNLLPTGFNKSLVEHHGTSHQLLHCTPTGSLKLVLPGSTGSKKSDRRLFQSASKFILMGLLFSNVFYGLFTEWMCQINPTNLGNSSSGGPSY